MQPVFPTDRNQARTGREIAKIFRLRRQFEAILA
jgi:hypothetical protein